MLKITGRKKQTKLEKEIDLVLDSMSVLGRDSTDYAAMADNLERLHKAKCIDTNRKVSPDTIAIIVGNLLGIVLILGYEKANIITSKALGFVIRGRV